MKQLLLLAFLMPLFTAAQDCKLKKEKDSFSQQPKLSTGFMPLSMQGGKARVNLEADSREIRMLFSIPGKCFDDASTAAFSFDSTRTKSNQKNSSAMNCEGMFTIVFRNGTTTPYALDKMGKQRVASIIFTGSNKEKTEIVLTEEEKAMLIEKAACLAREAKALLPS